MQPDCIKKKSELEAQKKKEQSKANQAQKKQHSPASAKKHETPVYNEYKSSSPSLKNISLKKDTGEANKDKTEEADIGNRPTQVFSDDELKTAWLRYAEKNKKNLPRMYQVFQNHIPTKAEGNKLVLSLDNDSQRKDFLERIHTDVMGFLKEQLSNYAIELNIGITQEIESKNLIYTATDKFKYLSEINPELEELKKKFNLDFE